MPAWPRAANHSAHPAKEPPSAERSEIASSSNPGAGTAPPAEEQVAEVVRPPDQVDEAEAGHPAAEDGMHADLVERPQGELAQGARPHGVPGSQHEEDPRLEAVEDEEEAKDHVGAHSRADS